MGAAITFYLLLIAGGYCVAVVLVYALTYMIRFLSKLWRRHREWPRL